MEIRIDTKKDSPEDIRKTIEFLKKLVEAGSGEFSAGSEASSGMATMFGDTPVLGSAPANDKEDDDSEEEKEKIELVPY
ncbi:MAG TPA: hypothetical protein VJ461_04190 [Candidatus Nanoarchaeia archaeon]|nr:hypothetical protein [Candidatus Nanoarchaeia archaeon]